MSSDLEPVILKRSLEKDEVPSSEASVPAVSGAPSEISSVSAAVQQPVKKAKKEKDPNAPKRPLNAYFLFQRDHRLHLKSNQPDLPFVEVNRSMNEAWEGMGAEERAKYENEAKVLLEAFNKENKAYKESKDGGVVSAAPEKAEESLASTAESVPVHEAALPVVSASSSSETPQSPKKKKKKEKHRESSE